MATLRSKVEQALGKGINYICPNHLPLPTIVCTVTNDITYDQRMQRICGSLANAGYQVLLVGRKLPSSKQLPQFSFRTKRLYCFFNKGFAFYAEYNLRLFFFLLFTAADCFYAVDLDTILPNYFVSALRGKKRLYDAHELFTEMKEIVTRPALQKFWLWVERCTVPKFTYGYTVNQFIKAELNKRYGVDYEVVRNMPLLDNRQQTIDDRGQLEGNQAQKLHHQPPINNQQTGFIIYQGAVNEGRSFETLIPAMKQVNCQLVVCGEGNFFEQAKKLIAENGLTNKINLKGYVHPQELRQLTPKALFGLTLFENTGLNQYYSLSNRFFDYIMAGIPQVCVPYPEYKAINDEHNVALFVENTNVDSLVKALNLLMEDDALRKQLQQNCLSAKKQLNWQNEEIKLLSYWLNVLPA